MIKCPTDEQQCEYPGCLNRESARYDSRCAGQVTPTPSPVSEEIAKLRDYAQHKDRCDAGKYDRGEFPTNWLSKRPDCTCGLDTLLSVRERGK